MGYVVKATPRPLYSREITGTHCIGGWVGPKAGLDGCGPVVLANKTYARSCKENVDTSVRHRFLTVQLVVVFYARI